HLLPATLGALVQVEARSGINVERISGMHPLPILGLPPLNYRYAKAPGTGHALRKPISLTIAQADALVEKIRHPRFVVPYIPFSMTAEHSRARSKHVPRGARPSPAICCSKATGKRIPASTSAFFRIFSFG